MIYIIGIFSAFFLSLIILTKKGRSLADIILGTWMIVIGLHLLTYYSYITGIIYNYPYLLGTNVPIPFFHGPLLYLYTLALTHPEKYKSKKWLWNCALPVFIILLYMPFWIYSPEQKLSIFQNEGKGFEFYTTLSTILLNLSGIVYVIITNRLLMRHKKRILDQFSDQEKINLNWLRFLFYIMVVMWILIIFIRNDDWIFSGASVFVILMGYFGIKQVGIFTNKNTGVPGNEPVEEPAEKNVIQNFTEPGTEKKKYARSGLSGEMIKDIHQKLTDLMQSEKLFTEPELNLSDLAARLDVHPNYLSQVINEIEGVNFYDYINALRIEEFKRLVALPENQKFTLLSIAYDCGFNSKSAFNRFFKKNTDLSPSEYIKLLNNK